MHRFFVPRAEIEEGEFALPAGEARHFSRVLRGRADVEITLLDGEGGRYLAKVESVSKQETIVGVLHREHVDQPLPRIKLYQCISKQKSMDWLIEKCTEIGVAHIVPIISTNAVAVPAEDKASAKAGKWRTLAVSALKQSGVTWLPRIDEPVSFSSAVSTLNGLCLVAALGNDVPPIKSVLRGLDDSESDEISIWIGPEGDFTPDELAILRDAGARCVSLGDSVLRTETAAFMTVGLVRYEFSR
ncbi:MAG: hypothetical protein CMO80_08560 [Verrucomicrobiales bacterium]|nr:hypothetical protein [Verrucomicrobiales bacterium]|tara:strand:- start:3107 stop:3838 length:732 start_codon:yes stop_codon:yes gene_type:complete